MNLCIFSGRLTRDPEIRHANSGTQITSFSIAVNSGWGDNEKTNFINCTLFKRENLVPHLTKGKAVTVTGELNIEKWTDKNTGQERQGVKLVVKDLFFQQGSAGQGQGQGSQRTQQAPPTMDDCPF